MITQLSCLATQDLDFNIKLNHVTLLVALENNNFQHISIINNGVCCSITRVSCAVNIVGSRILVWGQIKGNKLGANFNFLYFRARNIICRWEVGKKYFIAEAPTLLGSAASY